MVGGMRMIKKHVNILVRSASSFEWRGQKRVIRVS
jgi:hypothetical protein